MASVTRRSQSSRAARRDEVRDRLLVVVGGLLDDGESFTEISVERMVSAAGMSRSTFYVYFEDKGDLLRAWFADIRQEIAEAVSGWWRIDGDSDRDDLRAALADLVHVYHPHSALMAATFDAAAYDPSVRALTAELMEANVAALRKHIRLGQKAGFVAGHLHPEQTAQWLTWMAERALHVLLRPLSMRQIERHLDVYADIVWGTLYARSPARP